MWIYILESYIFFGQKKCIVSSFPIPQNKVEELANDGNNYSEQDKWKVVKVFG